MDKVMKKVFVGLGIIFVVGVLLFVIGFNMQGNSVKEKEAVAEYTTWLSQNCECLAHERYFCNDGFKLEGVYCVNEETEKYTNRFNGCSEYDCDGEIKIWNNEIENWEDVLNG